MIKWNYLLQKFVNFWFLTPKKRDHFFKKKCQFKTTWSSGITYYKSLLIFGF